MAAEGKSGKRRRESIFLNENVMAAACAIVVAASLGSLYFFFKERDYFQLFELLTKLATAVGMFFAFKFYKWDVAKGLMGGVLFSLLYQEAYLVFAELWGSGDFDTYLMVGVQGSLYMAAAGMTFMMTVIITANHFFINYTAHGNAKNTILNRVALGFKLLVYVILFSTNGLLGLSSVLLWKNDLQYVTDIALLAMLVCVESQLNEINTLRNDLMMQKRERRRAT